MSRLVSGDHDKHFPAPYLKNESQKISFNGTSAQSSAFGSGTTLVRCYSAVACYIARGVNPTASATTIYWPAGLLDYVGVLPGEKIAVIQESSAGTFHISECK